MTDEEITTNEEVGAARDPRPLPVISAQTRRAAAIMALALIAAITLDVLSASGAFGDAGDLALAALTLVPLAVAALILPVAKTFAKGPIRTQWVLFGVGMLSAGIGAAIFIALYLITGADPYPSVADVFTLAGYGFFAAGLFSAITSYRELLDIRPALWTAFGLSAVAMAVVYFLVIGPYVVFAPEETQSLATRIFNTLYPVLDVFVLAMPAIALGLLVSKLGSGRVAWPWWFVVASASTLALTDTLFAYAGYIGAGRTPLIDAGYAVAPILLGFAVLVARDVYRS